MADVILLRDSSVPAILRFRYVDMGDTTHALASASTVVHINTPANSPRVGQVVIAVTGTAVRLLAPSVPLPTASVLVYSLAANAAAGGTVGGAGVTNVVNGAGNGYILEPGQSMVIMPDDINEVYVNGTAGDIFGWSAG